MSRTSQRSAALCPELAAERHHITPRPYGVQTPAGLHGAGLVWWTPSHRYQPRATPKRRASMATQTYCSPLRYRNGGYGISLTDTSPLVLRNKLVQASAAVDT